MKALILSALLLLAGCSTVQQPLLNDCTTDYECEVLGHAEEPITSWGEWADAGCTEEHRDEALCSAFEQTKGDTK